MLARAPRDLAALASRGIFEVWRCFLSRLPRLWQLMRCCCHTGARENSREIISSQLENQTERCSDSLQKELLGFPKKEGFLPTGNIGVDVSSL